MNLASFYTTIRKTFTLTNKNVQGFDQIIAEGLNRKIPLNDLAYMMATAWLETANTMQPIKEYGGTAYFFKMYDPFGSRPSVAKRLGNTQRGDGAKFAGRGYVQLTGRGNYEKASKKFGVDFVANPDLVMDPQYALPILFVGMQEGWFTGKKLRDFIDEIDESDKEDGKEFEGARRIINGTDKAKMISGYALVFEKALKAGGYSLEPDEPKVEEVTVCTTVPKEHEASLQSVVAEYFKSLLGVKSA